jgi:hypothetical protein
MNRLIKHASGAVLEGSLVALLVVGLMAGTAFAGKGGGGGKPGGGSTGTTGNSIAIVNSDPDGIVNHGDTITFAVTTAASRPFVSLKCTVGGTLVYTASAGYFADYPWTRDFILSSNSWTSGGADCTARLYSTTDGVKTTTLATKTFAVAA